MLNATETQVLLGNFILSIVKETATYRVAVYYNTGEGKLNITELIDNRLSTFIMLNQYRTEFVDVSVIGLIDITSEVTRMFKGGE